MPTLSVRVRILASILLVTALGMTVAGGAAHLVQRDLALRDVDVRLEASAGSLRALISGEGVQDPGSGSQSQPPPSTVPTFASAEEAVQLAVSRIVPDRNESTVGIVDGAARWVPGTRMDFHLEDDPAFIARVLSEIGEGAATIRGTALTTLGPLRYLAVPIRVGDGPELGIFLTAFNLDGELEEARTAVTTYVWTAAAALAVIALVGWFVAGRLLRPIRLLRSTAGRITATDLSERIPVRGNDDVSALTTTINDMLERLEQSMAAQGRLLADVRHELMTPITIVRGHLELLDARDTADVEATRVLAIDELDRMTGLVRDMELLAAAQGGSPLEPVPTDVEELTAQVYAKASALGEHEWVCAESAPAVIVVDPARITQAWLQLADNARKYSSAGSTIEIGSTLVDGQVHLWVADEGPGVPDDARERIFERFGRVDSGRGVSGSGLGLSIVSAIARAHGGRVELQPSDVGARFAIIVPDHSEESE